jgi:hypothetical protein
VPVESAQEYRECVSPAAEHEQGTDWVVHGRMNRRATASSPRRAIAHTRGSAGLEEREDVKAMTPAKKGTVAAQ